MEHHEYNVIFEIIWDHFSCFYFIGRSQKGCGKWDGFGHPPHERCQETGGSQSERLSRFSTQDHWGEAEELSLMHLMKRSIWACDWASDEEDVKGSWTAAYDFMIKSYNDARTKLFPVVTEGARGSSAARWVFSLAIRKQKLHLEHRAAWVQVALRAGGNSVSGGFQGLTRQNPHWPAPALIIAGPWIGMSDL